MKKYYLYSDGQFICMFEESNDNAAIQEARRVLSIKGLLNGNLYNDKNVIIFKY